MTNHAENAGIADNADNVSESAHTLAAEKLNLEAGIKTVHVPGTVPEAELRQANAVGFAFIRNSGKYGNCGWYQFDQLGRKHRMYDIIGTVTTVAPAEFRLMGHWPLRWWQARCTRFTMIQRRLLPNETLPWPQEPVIEEEICVDRDRWQDLEVGDRVIVRAFWPGESEIVHSAKGGQGTTGIQPQPQSGKVIRVRP